MTRGRPKKPIDTDLVITLRSQGLTWAEVAIKLGVHRNTLQLARVDALIADGKLPMKRCGGYCKRVLPLEAFSIDRSRRDNLNIKCRECCIRRWKELYSSPCVDCGFPRRSVTLGQCARCYRMTALLKREEYEVASLIGRMIQGRRKELLGDLVKDERMRPADKLMMLVERVTNGTPRNIATQS